VPLKISLGDGQDLECVEEFCYLGYDWGRMGLGGGESARARVKCAWSKFKESLDIKGSIFEGEIEGIRDFCEDGDGVIMVYGSET